MAVLEQENRLDCEGTEAWRVLADFGAFLAWATAGAGTTRLEGEGVGMVRHLDIPGLGQVSERLDLLDEASHTLNYTMVSEQMAGMASYSASVQVISDGPGHCRLLWRGTFEPAAGFAADEVGRSLADSYLLMSQALAAYVSGQAAAT